MKKDLLVFSLLFILFGAALFITSCINQKTIQNGFTPNPERTLEITPSLQKEIATSTLSSHKSAFATAEARDYATQVVIQSTEEAMFPECQFVTNSSISANRIWKHVQCINPGIGFYNLNDSQQYWFYAYDDLAGKFFSEGIPDGYVDFLGWSGNEEYAYFSIFESGDGPCPLFYQASMIYRINLVNGDLQELIPYGFYAFTLRQSSLMFVEQNDTKQIHLLNLDSLETTTFQIAEFFDATGFILWNDGMDQLIVLGKNQADTGKDIYKLVLMDILTGDQSIVYQGEIGYIPEDWMDSDQIRLTEECSSKGYLLNLNSPNLEIIEDTLGNDIQNGSEFRSGQFQELSELSCEPSTNPYKENPNYDPIMYDVMLYPNIEIAQVCTFTGHIERGEYFQQMILDDLRFCLVPGSFSTENENEGWNIIISDMEIGACNSASATYANFGEFVTPPHYGNLSFYVYGYQFRNVENTGANDGSVNAPQKEHAFNFMFSRNDFMLSRYEYRCERWSLEEDCLLATPPSEGYQIPRSRMIFTITDIELGNLVSGGAAWIENMSFEVKVYLPADN